MSYYNLFPYSKSIDGRVYNGSDIAKFENLAELKDYCSEMLDTHIFELISKVKSDIENNKMKSSKIPTMMQDIAEMSAAVPVIKSLRKSKNNCFDDQVQQIYHALEKAKRYCESKSGIDVAYYSVMQAKVVSYRMIGRLL